MSGAPPTARPRSLGASDGSVGLRAWSQRRARAWRSLWPPLLRHGVRPLLLTSDLLACTAAALLSGASVVVAVVFSLTLVGFFALGGLYRSRLHLAVLDDMPSVLGRLMMASAVVLIPTAAAGGSAAIRHQALLSMAAAVLLPLGRAASYAAVAGLRGAGGVNHSTLIVGTGKVGRELAAALEDHPEYGLRPTAFLDPDHRATSAGSLPVYHDAEDLPRLLSRGHFRTLVLAYGRLSSRQLVDMIRDCQRHRCEVFVVPRLYELHHVGNDMDLVWGTPLIRLRRAPHRSMQWRLKRVLDLVLASVALVLAAPVMAACALAVRLEGGPGVLFRQFRVGLDGRSFALLKFRSLRPVDETESATQWNIAQDHRLGPVGRFLRTTSLDELPQLVNVLRGDMSLVGPRPERPHFVEEFAGLYPGYLSRHRVPCGLTGLAQVHGLRGDTSIYQRARFDNFYIENWSLWLDLKIMLRTVRAVVRSPGG